MRFHKLTEYFEQLEQTSARLSLIDILAELFSQVDQSEVGIVCYLVQGRVAPFYDSTEIGMAEKSVAASVARSFNTDKEQVLAEYGKLGDLGLATQVFNISTKASNLTVQDVFNELTKIAHFSGDGTVENKISTLSALLSKMSSVEAKHLVRIPLGVSRLGIGDPTILDAFAQLKLGSRSKRKVLETAYNKVSDLGLIGSTLWSEGEEAVAKLEVTVGRPLRSQLCERISSPESLMEKFGGIAHVQEKYDGFRVQIHKDGNNVRFYSRNLEETTNMFPDLVAGVLAQIKAKTVILDSEAIAFNPLSEEFLPFQETTKRRRKHGIEESAEELPLKAFVFDIMYLNGKSLVDLPLIERMKILEQTVEEGDVLIPNTGKVVDNAAEIQRLFDAALTEGLEGLIMKRPDSVYEAGARNFNWVKMKKHSSGELNDTIDCVILGYIFGRGKRADFGAGALLVGVYDSEKDEFVTVSKIGTGLSDDEWRYVHQVADKIKLDHKPARVNSLLTPSVWIEPEIVIEVLADEITKSPNHTAGWSDDTKSGYALRFPRLVRFRGDDKVAEDCTSVQELIELYNLQYQKK